MVDFVNNDWCSENSRTYRVWNVVRMGGVAVWFVWDVDVKDYPDGEEHASETYIPGGKLYVAAGAGNPERAVEQGDSKPVQASNIPDEVIERVREIAKTDGYSQAGYNGDATDGDSDDG